ncbi:diaminobutyrate--2-oxoglutarate transaminase [Corallococcus carmarthensis]|uniref:diaminobutyrate--2-oxoglutarate transaminase n=1 Tax=Corallococcus carmarthensis TaxID=2316728 RepID=UPI00148B8AB6|nr:diaminobutyrate--2-oxoglutarate transaminase [Corallococcus carmarthensis]NOK15673.1 diaminobutyrate--2-oxoglutarate transaminase [Corallococcus carmarthensis]
MSSQPFASDDHATTVFEQRESNVRLYCHSFPAVFTRAKGSTIFDTQGKRYLDFFAGAGALNYGHNPEPIKRKVMEYLEGDGIVHALDAYTAAKRDFLTHFEKTILGPRGLEHKVQFCGPTGTNAVEAALKLARKVTKRTGLFAFTGAYHGMTLGSSAVTSSRGVRAAAGIPLGHTTFIPYPEGPKGPFDSLAFMERMLEDSCSGVDVPAAVIIESAQMDGGIYVASAEWLRALRKLTEKHGILLIVDDIQAGCGRSGQFFSFERAGIVPDLVTLSKSIGGYGFPMSLLLMKPALDQWRPGEHTGTFRGNQVAFVAATAALDYWTQEEFTKGLAAKSQLLGELAREAAPGLEVRGLGMAYGIDLTDHGGYERGKTVQQRCFQRGLILELCGRDDTVIKLLPPLTTSVDELREGVAILAAALSEV